jgi:hypothetical protein
MQVKLRGAGILCFARLCATDSCKFLHDRSDHKHGWQLEREEHATADDKEGALCVGVLYCHGKSVFHRKRFSLRYAAVGYFELYCIVLYCIVSSIFAEGKRCMQV